MPVVDHLHLAAGRLQQGAEGGLGHAVHGIQHHPEIAAADGIHVHSLHQVVQVFVQGIDFPNQALGLCLSVLQLLHRLLHLVNVRLNLPGLDLVRVPASRSENLDAVVDGRVVAGRYHHAVGKIMPLHIVHGQGRGAGLVDQAGPDAVCREHAGRPLHGLLGQEAPVIAHDDSPLRHPLILHFPAQCPGQNLNVLLRESIPDDGSPAACPKTNHAASPLILFIYCGFSGHTCFPAGNLSRRTIDRASSILFSQVCNQISFNCLIAEPLCPFALRTCSKAGGAITAYLYRDDSIIPDMI